METDPDTANMCNSQTELPGVQVGQRLDAVLAVQVAPDDMQATLMHLFGINHEGLLFRYQGRQFRLTDVEGHVVKGMLKHA